MKRRTVAFLTGHTPGSGRKASLIHFADCLTKQGHKVIVVRIGTSYFGDLLRGQPQRNERINSEFKVHDDQTGYLAHTWFHPFNTHNSILNRALSLLFGLYSWCLPASLVRILRAVDTVVCESGLGVTLIPRIRKLNPAARLFYAASDRLETIGVHPLICATERKVLHHFERIRVPAVAMLEDFKGYPVIFIPQGMDTHAFDAATKNPFKGPLNAVSIGDMLFDHKAIATLAKTYPGWTFHLIGKKARLKHSMSNVIEYGEMPYEQTIGFIKYADIGLAPYRESPSSDYLSQSSLKMVQYTYCRLPIVAPHFAEAGRTNVIGYNPTDEASLIHAFNIAAHVDRSKIHSKTPTWGEATRLFLDFERKNS